MYTSETPRPNLPNFWCVLTVAIARCSPGGVVMYFHIMAHHIMVCIAKLQEDGVTAETIVSVPTECCSMAKTSKYQCE